MNTRYTNTLFLILALGFCSVSFAQTAKVQLLQKVVASDRAQDDHFGSSVSIFGNYAVVGASSEDEDTSGSNTASGAGAAYIYEINTTTGVWDEVQKLIASDRAAGDSFGAAVSIVGSYVVVGAPAEDENSTGGSAASSAGSVYIFERNSTTGIWTQVQKLVASDRATGDHFGAAVSISGNYIVVGSSDEDEDAIGNNTLASAGSVYIFQRNSSTGTWAQAQKVIASDRSADAFFGFSVCVLDDQLIAGAKDESTTGAGAAYIFKRNSVGVWNPVQKIVASDKDTLAHFGYSVSIDNEYALVGAPGAKKDTAGSVSIAGAGAAYLFRIDSLGSWNQVAKLVSSDRDTNAQFGHSVSFSNGYALVAAPFDDTDTSASTLTADAGAAYLFELNPSTQSWVQTNKFLAENRDVNDLYGFSVNLSGSSAIIGAPGDAEDANDTNSVSLAGSAYIYSINGAFRNSITWTGAVSTTWETAANWDKLRLPTPADSVNIPATTTSPTLNTNVYYIQSLKVFENAELFLDNGGLYIVGGNAVVDGKITGLGAKKGQGVVFGLGSSYKGKGKIDVLSVVVAMAGNVSYDIHTTVQAGGALQVISYIPFPVTLTIIDSLIMEANDTAAASLVPVPPGVSIAGNITKQTWMGAIKGWRHLGANVANAQLKDIADDIALYGFSGVSASTGSSNTFWYDPTTSTYKKPSNGLNTAMGVGRGWQVFTNFSEPMFDMTGPVIYGTVNYPVAGGDSDFNLLANSYPSEINWDTTGWTSNNIGATIYIWDAANVVYATYDKSTGTATGNGSKYIASGQSFFVQNTGGSPSLSSNEAVKSILQYPDFLKEVEHNILHLKLIDVVGRETEALVGLHPEAKAENDELDAALFSPRSSVEGLSPQLELATSGKVQNFLPLPTEGERHILSLHAKANAGAASLTLTGISSLEHGVLVYLERKDGGQRILLAEGDELPTTETSEWMLVIENELTSLSAVAHSSLELYPNPASVGGAITLELPFGSQAGSLTITDAQGRLVTQHLVRGTQAIIEAPAIAGIYMLMLQTEQGMTVGRVVIK